MSSSISSIGKTTYNTAYQSGQRCMNARNNITNRQQRKQTISKCFKHVRVWRKPITPRRYARIADHLARSARLFPSVLENLQNQSRLSSILWNYSGRTRRLKFLLLSARYFCAIAHLLGRMMGSGTEILISHVCFMP